MMKLHVPDEPEFVRSWTPQEVAAIRCYCAEHLQHDIARIAVTTRDHGAAVFVHIEMPNGYRHGVMLVADGDNDDKTAEEAVAVLKAWINARRVTQ